eukprot:9485530-Pyramimonas_sp.AAC.1
METVRPRSIVVIGRTPSRSTSPRPRSSAQPARQPAVDFPPTDTGTVSAAGRQEVQSCIGRLGSHSTLSALRRPDGPPSRVNYIQTPDPLPIPKGGTPVLVPLPRGPREELAPVP